MAKKIVTKKQHVILLLLYIFRFVNSKQLQEFLGHKDHRRINSWLKDLTTKGYVERDFTVRYGATTKPARYNLSIKGRAHIKESYDYYFPAYLKRVARDNKASKAFRVKCQIIADWYLFVLPTPRRNTEKTSQKEKITGIHIIDYIVPLLHKGVSEEKETIPLNIKQFFTSAYFPSFVLVKKIKPDSYLRMKTNEGIAHALLFVIDAYVVRIVLQNTIKRIFNTLREEYWEDDNINSLQMYILCPNNQIIIYLKRLTTSFMKNYYGGTHLSFHFATRNQFYKCKNGTAKEVGWRTISSEDE